MSQRQLILIRHAESLANAGFRTSDPGSIPLTELGHEQAEAAARSLTRTPTLIISSPMKRAMQTMDALSKVFPDVPVEIWPVQEFVFLDLRERGAISRHDRRPLVDAYWAREDPDEQGWTPICESFCMFYNRVISFHQRAASHPTPTLAVVSHGFFLHALLYARNRGFPPCTKALMGAIHQASLTGTPANAEVIQSIRDLSLPKTTG